MAKTGMMAACWVDRNTESTVQGYTYMKGICKAQKNKKSLSAGYVQSVRETVVCSVILLVAL